MLVNKILAKSAHVNSINPGNKLILDVDFCLINDGVSNVGVDGFSEKDELFDNNRVIVVIDHDTPAGSEEAAKTQRKLIDFAKQYDTFLYNGSGISNNILIEDFLSGGEIVVGCNDDMLTVGAVGAIGITVKPDELTKVMKSGKIAIEAPEIIKIELVGEPNESFFSKDIILEVIRQIGTEKLQGKIIEFAGEALCYLTKDDRITICHMASKLGAMSAIVNDEVTSDESNYSDVFTFDISTIEPLVVKPDNYEEITRVKDLDKVAVNEVFLGGTAGGKIEDLRVAANILKNKKIAYKLRMIVAPTSSKVYVQALKEGLLTTFLDAGCLVMNQGCSVDYGKSQGIIDTTEVLVSAGRNNDKGNAGSEDGKIYIVSPAVAAYTAIAGYILV